VNQLILRKGRIPALLCAGLLASGMAFAEQPRWSDGGHENKGKNGYASQTNKKNSDKRDNYDSRGRNDSGRRFGGSDGGNRNFSERDRSYRTRYLDDRRRNEIHDYYARRIRDGHCPPGLRKKQNGCQPPGHARRWQVGQRLPRDVIFYNVEPQVLTYLGPPPPRHRYVRVASDILLITIGTGMVIDAIDDLDRY
jgi:hypothetical protein